MELEKRYWTLKSGTRTGKFDLETFTPLVSLPIPQCLCPGMILHKGYFFFHLCHNSSKAITVTIYSEQYSDEFKGGGLA